MSIYLILSNMRNSIYILLVLLALFASCEKNTGELVDDQPIRLSVSLPGAFKSKVPFQGSAPTTTSPLNVDVWASTTSMVFEHKTDSDGKPLDGRNEGANNEVSVHTTGHFQSGEPQLLSQAVYPPPRVGSAGSYTAASVYFVAMHPQSAGDRKWSTTDGKQAVYTFSGYEDVMYAKEVSGAYDTSEDLGQVVTNSPVLAFDHLLTRFTVKMGIDLEEGESLWDVQNAWGEITDLRIQSYNSAGYGENLNTVTIDLSMGNSFNYDSNVSFSGQQGSSMGFYALGTDSSFPGASGYTLTEQIDSVAYVMCAPVVATTANHEYIITLETRHRGIQELKLDIQKTASSADGTGTTRGNHFLVTLKFNKGRTITSVVDVMQWENGGFGSGNIVD